MISLFEWKIQVRFTFYSVVCLRLRIFIYMYAIHMLVVSYRNTTLVYTTPRLSPLCITFICLLILMTHISSQAHTLLRLSFAITCCVRHIYNIHAWTEVFSPNVSRLSHVTDYFPPVNVCNTILQPASERKMLSAMLIQHPLNLKLKFHGLKNNNFKQNSSFTCWKNKCKFILLDRAQVIFKKKWRMKRWSFPGFKKSSSMILKRWIGTWKLNFSNFLDIRFIRKIKMFNAIYSFSFSDLLLFCFKLTEHGYT